MYAEFENESAMVRDRVTLFSNVHGTVRLSSSVGRINTDDNIGKEYIIRYEAAVKNGRC